MIDRREFAVGASVLTAIAASGASGCSPAPYYKDNGQGLFAALRDKDATAVTKLMDQSVQLVVIDADKGMQVFSGPLSVSEFIFSLIFSKNYHFAPNTSGKYEADDEIFAWLQTDSFGWERAALWRPVAVEGGVNYYANDGCGDFETDSFNVFLSGSPIKNIALVRDRLAEPWISKARAYEAKARS
ncbi:MAG: hypothetical protein ABL918_04720 [Chakrabartia sp.]